MGIEFNKRTIITTAINGTAAVVIDGETTACVYNLLLDDENKIEVDKDFENSLMIIINEVSFMGEIHLERANDYLNIKCDVNTNCRFKFGNLQVLFAGDFGQLPPPMATLLYECKKLHLWHDSINTYMELKTNHRFKNDKIREIFSRDLKKRVQIKKDEDYV